MAKKILVADDDPLVKETLKEILEYAGYEVDFVANGEECLKKILIDKPDLLLLDIMMPRMDGFSFLAAIKELRALTGNAPDMPVMVMTGKDIDTNKSFENISLMTYENIKGYFTKPPNLNELLAKIKKVLGE